MQEAGGKQAGLPQHHLGPEGRARAQRVKGLRWLESEKAAGTAAALVLKGSKQAYPPHGLRSRENSFSSDCEFLSCRGTLLTTEEFLLGWETLRSNCESFPAPAQRGESPGERLERAAPRVAHSPAQPGQASRGLGGELRWRPLCHSEAVQGLLAGPPGQWPRALEGTRGAWWLCLGL